MGLPSPQFLCTMLIMHCFKVVSCLLAAVLADPLGAGAAGDGCELQKVSRKEEEKSAALESPLLY